MEKQTTKYLLMIRPVRFGYNPQTAVNNAFQVADEDQLRVHQEALNEFDTFVKTLEEAGVDVTVVQDTEPPHTPDSIFPNNWISFHAEGKINLYPMYAENRRLERKQAVLDTLKNKFLIQSTKDYSYTEADQIFLEGTGSMVLDRENKLAYACLSPRTNIDLLKQWCNDNRYTEVSFTANDMKGAPIYHTNVVMAVADRYVVICLDTIMEAEERQRVEGIIKQSGKEIIEISFEQMNHFAGNMLQVENERKEKILVMSSQAWNALKVEQKKKLSAYNRIVHSDLTVIESNGGGSARCMMAEVHLDLLP